MSAFPPRLSSQTGGVHPAVLDRRVRDSCLLAITALIPLAVALAITLSFPKPNVLLFLAGIAGALGVIALMVSSRLEVTVAALALYLGLLDGPVKLGLGGGGGGEGVSAVRNVLILAVGLGAILRLVVKRERVRMPPLSGWVIAFIALVVVEALNPKTTGLLKVLGGYRQQLEWVPFFFFGYVVMRSKERFRKFFLILGVIALANGVVGTYQTQISPGQLASWGAGYRVKVEGVTEEAGNGATKHRGARKYSSEGVGRVRPMALGGDSGFGGAVGLVALPCILALLATGRTHRRWIGLLLCMGALVAVVTGLGRLQLVGALLGVLSFLLLASAAHRVKPALGALLAVAVLAVPFGILFVSAEQRGTFSRYETLVENKTTSKCTDCKTEAWTFIPNVIAAAPFGVGLGSVGPAGGFGGKNTNLVEGHGVSSETQYNFITNELGAPGLFLWVALSIMLIVLAVRRIPRVADIELRICLAGVFAPIIAIVLIGFSGPVSASSVLGPYFWFAAGIAAYWLAGPMRGAFPASTRQSPGVGQGPELPASGA